MSQLSYFPPFQFAIPIRRIVDCCDSGRGCNSVEIGEDDSAEGGAGGTITNGLGFGHTCGVGTFT